MKKLIRERVVPTISARVSWQIAGMAFGSPLPKSRQQQQRARQPLLARIEELVHQVLFDADIARQHVRQEALPERRLRVKDLLHLRFLDDQERRCHRAVAVDIRRGCPARHPSPRKLPVLRIPTTASFPSWKRRSA